MLREELKKITIYDLLNKKEISVRTSNCCCNAYFNSLYDILCYYENGESFYNIRNAGEKTCLELHDLCKKIILQIEKTDDNSEEKLFQNKYVDVKDLMENDIANAIDNQLVNENDILSYFSLQQKIFLEDKFSKLKTIYSIKTINILRPIGLKLFITQYLLQNNDEIIKINDLGIISIREIIKIKEELKFEIQQLITTIKENKIKVKTLNKNDLLNAIENKVMVSKDIFNFISLEQKAILEEIYNRLKEMCTNRTMNRFRLIDFETFVSFYLFQNDKELLKIDNLGKKNLKEAVELKEKMKVEFQKIIMLPEEDIKIIDLIRQKGVVIQNDFAFIFYKQNNHLPMFWILEQFIKTDNSREIKILVDSFPIFHNNQQQELKNIAKKYGITRERVRQIRNKTFKKTFKITDDIIEHKNKSELIKYVQLVQNKEDWSYILNHLQETNYINQESSEIQEYLIKKEQCTLSVEFVLQIIAYLFRTTFSLFGGFEVSNKDRIWKNTFLIRKEFTNIFNFEKFIKEFSIHISDNRTEYDLNIDEFLSNSACWTSVIDLVKFDNIVRVVKDILLYEFCLYSNLDGLITIPATKERNPLDIVYDILKIKGESMYIDDIFVEFKKILPKHKYTEAAQLRPWLQKHDAISFRNRNSVYTLKEWKHIKIGTIRDIIIEFLLKNDLPQTADNITDYVLQHFPETNIASVRTTMFNDTKKRFSFFNENLFGLVSKKYPSECEEIKQQGLRKVFEQRLYDLEKFLSENDHFPFSTSDNKDEISLFRWWRMQNKNTAKLTTEQKKEIERLKFQYSGFETDKTAYEWFNHFNNFKLFVLENRCFPSAIGSEKFLYNWFCRAKDDFLNDRLSEKQRTKYAELFKEIRYVER